MIHYYYVVCAWLRRELGGVRLQARLDSERGASLVEYALLVALIAVVCVGAVTFLGRAVGNSLSNAGSSLN